MEPAMIQPSHLSNALWAGVPRKSLRGTELEGLFAARLPIVAAQTVAI